MGLAGAVPVQRALLVGVGLCVRLTVEESPEFERSERAGSMRLPIVSVLREHSGQVLCGIPIFGGRSEATTARCSAQLGSIFGGALAPIVVTLLPASSAGMTGASVYLVVMVALSGVGALGAARLSRRSRAGVTGPGGD